MLAEVSLQALSRMLGYALLRTVSGVWNSQ
jgi:hypothetical protein